MSALNGNGALLLTVEQTSTLLNVSKNTVYSLIQQDIIPHLWLGRSLRVPRFGLERWIADQADIAAPVSQGVELPSTPPKH